MSKIDPTIFRKYDIRGVVPGQLDSQKAKLIAESFAAYLQENNHRQKVVVGCDGRVSSPDLKAVVIEGLLNRGVDVLDIGLVSTPLAYFANFNSEYESAIMITGSHNPKDFNGMKFVLDRKPFFDQQLTGLCDAINKGLILQNERKGSLEIRNISKEYVDFVVRKALLATLPSDLRIGWDPGNGAVGAVLPELLGYLPNQNFLINGEVDGNFPNHHPDPSVSKNLNQLRDLITKEGLDYGIAFDGDGDRVGVLDSKGDVVSNEILMQLFTDYHSKTHDQPAVIFDIKTSAEVLHAADKLGAKPILWKTGHSYIKEKMAELNAKFAAEMSGHMFFAENFGYDDGIFAAAKFLELVSSGYQLDNYKINEVSTDEMRIDCADDKKFGVIDKIRAKLDSDGKKYNGIDGVRIDEEGGWWLLRASNTQPALVLRVAANNQEELDELYDSVKDLLKLFINI